MDWFNFGKSMSRLCSVILLTKLTWSVHHVKYWINPKLESRLPREISATSRYAEETTLMDEREEELKSLLMRVKEMSEKPCLKLSIKKTKIMTSSLMTSWQIEGKKWKQWQILLGSKTTVDGDCSHEIKKMLVSWKKSYDKHRQHIKKRHGSENKRSI